ncbi:MAG: glycosyltransferase family 2 protein [Candidatus Baldrarchaeia archaeon]
MPKVSVIIPTRDRPWDLMDLLLTILNQNYMPIEVIIIDDSRGDSTRKVINFLIPQFKRRGCELMYVKGNGEGLPAARNLGVKMSRGNAVLFLDDDTLLNPRVIISLAAFLRDNPKALGVSPVKLEPLEFSRNYGLITKFANAISKLLMLGYKKENTMTLRKSGAIILPNNVGKVVPVQKLYGNCCCFRREVFNELRFDNNLKRWAYMEDLDFCIRVYKKYPNSLYLIPNVVYIHKRSQEARLPSRLSIYMTTIYWFYVFFKDIFEGSMLNLLAFLWALLGNLAFTLGGLLIKRKEKSEWWSLIYLLESYAVAFKNLKEILSLKLDFFNKKLVK